MKSSLNLSLLVLCLSILLWPEYLSKENGFLSENKLKDKSS
jgi:hypothetical protein